MSETFAVSEKFTPRPVTLRGVREVGGYRIKEYAIVYGPSALSIGQFEMGLPTAFAALPNPAVTTSRPGAGFVILHQGRGARYIILGWWDNENELPLRIWTQPSNACGAPWLPASASQSVCVWDLEVLNFERHAYVERVLRKPEGPDLKGYLLAAFRN